MLKTPYGYILDANGRLTINAERAAVVQIIYQNYLIGNSLGKISDILFKYNIPSPSGNSRWTRATIDKMLSNGKYVPHIIDFEQFTKVQFEKHKRSNVDLDSGKRSAKRYISPVMEHTLEL